MPPLTEKLYVRHGEEPILTSPEGIEVYDRDESLLLSTEEIRDSDGPDGLIVSIEELPNIALEATEIAEDTDEN